jgi:hypothetical protein
LMKNGLRGLPARRSGRAGLAVSVILCDLEVIKKSASL